MHSFLVGLALLAAEPAIDQASETKAAPSDLFPRAGHLTALGATGLPVYAVAELAIGLTDNLAIGAAFGLTPWVWTAGIRPRFHVRIAERTALVLLSPLLYYPSASGAEPGELGRSPWLLARPELFVDRAVAERWHVMGGMGVVAVASTGALKNLVTGHDFEMPAYGGDPKATRGFAGGLWNTLAGRASCAIGERTNVFAEASLVMRGVVPADDVGGPPVILNVGVTHAF